MSYYYMDPNNQTVNFNSYAYPYNAYVNNQPTTYSSFPVQNYAYPYPNPQIVNSDYYTQVYAQNPPLQLYPSYPLPESQRIHEAASDTFESLPSSETVSETDSNGKYYRGVTPLHKAVSNDNFGMVKKLVEEGADIHATTFRGKTPLSYAMNNYKRNLDEKKFKIIEFLVKAGGYSDKVVDTSIKNLLEPEIFILKYGVYVPHSGNVDILIKAGANKQAMKELVVEKYNNCDKEKLKNLTMYFEESLKKLDGISTIVLENRSSKTADSKQCDMPKGASAATFKFSTSHNVNLLAIQKANKLAKDALRQL